MKTNENVVKNVIDILLALIIIAFSIALLKEIAFTRRTAFLSVYSSALVIFSLIRILVYYYREAKYLDNYNDELGDRILRSAGKEFLYSIDMLRVTTRLKKAEALIKSIDDSLPSGKVVIELLNVLEKANKKGKLSEDASKSLEDIVSNLITAEKPRQ